MPNCLRYGVIPCFLLAIGFVVTGCSQQGERLNAPPQGDTSRPNTLQNYFVYMVDNAMMHDSSVADIHFEPHISELSGLGVRRLMRMGELLGRCGGTICYETSLRDDGLVEARLDTIRGFLASSGFDTNAIMVEASLARSHKLAASEAIEIKLRGTMDSPASGQGGTTPFSIGSN